MTEPAPRLGDVIALEQIDENLYRANFVFDEEWSLYGGQAAAQALLAAGLTVGDRRPHSLHGYFLRAGDAARPTIFQVFRDRDGRSFSARRVVALQGGEVIFNASMSFQTPVEAPSRQVPAMPETLEPADGEPYPIQRLFSCEGRVVPQPDYGQDPALDSRWPARFWSRCTDPAMTAGPLLDACALTYLSDISCGLAPFAQDGWQPGPSLDHAIWFHQPGVTGDWLLNEFQPITATGDRGMYTGTVFDRAGRLVATIAQETVFRNQGSWA